MLKRERFSMPKAYKEAREHMLWFRRQFAPYTAEQAALVAEKAELDETRAVFGMLIRSKEWVEKHGAYWESEMHAPVGRPRGGR